MRHFPPVNRLAGLGTLMAREVKNRLVKADAYPWVSIMKSMQILKIQKHWRESTLQRIIGDVKLILSIDRLDYRNIPQRLGHLSFFT